MIRSAYLETSMARRRNKGEERAIAATRINILLRKARAEVLAGEPDLGPRYVRMARAVGTKQQLSFRSDQKVLFCKGCDQPRTSATTRIRLRGGRITTTCTCGHIHRRPL